MKDETQHCFNRPGNMEAVRVELAQSANRILPSVKEPRLKAFCFRLADQALEDDKWIEGVASFLCSKPPAKWIDNDLSQFEDELHRCTRQFSRVESTLFGQGDESDGMQAMRVSITCQDGSEVDKVVRLSEGELKKVATLEEKIRLVLGDDSRLGLVAATRIVRDQLLKETS
jgi:hypothetical protein